MFIKNDLDRLRSAASIVDNYLLNEASPIADVAAAISCAAACAHLPHEYFETCLKEFREIGSISDAHLVRVRSIFEARAAFDESDLPPVLKLLKVNRMLGQFVAGNISLSEIQQIYYAAIPLGLGIYTRHISEVLAEDMNLTRAPDNDPNQVTALECLGHCIGLRIEIRALWDCMMNG